MRKPIVKHPKDVLPLIIAYSGMAFTVATLSLNMQNNLMLFVLLSMAAFICRVVALPHQHNHSHLSTFHSNTLNTIHNFNLSILTGYTTAGWTLHHSLGHHRLLNDINRDPTYIGRFARPDGSWISRCIHVFAVELFTFRDARHIAKSLPSRIGRPHLHALWRQTILQHMVYIVLLLWNPWPAFINLICMNKILRLIVVKASYDHHYHPNKPDFVGSNNKLPCPWYLFNLGYHAAHHTSPTLHWTKLPEKHLEIYGDHYA